MKNNRYSNLKIVNFPAKIESFRSGVVTAPLYVRLKPINSCNHGCRFCCVAGTLILTSAGVKAIENIRPTDRVISPSGSEVVVVSTTSRRATRVLQISADGESIEVTPEHPFLTEDGWKEAGHLAVGDSTFMQVRLRSTSKAATAMVGGLSQESSTKGHDHARGSQNPIGQNADQQSHVQSGDSRSRGERNQGQAEAVHQGASGECRASVPRANEWPRQPHEESGNCTTCTYEEPSEAGDIQERDGISGMGHSDGFTDYSSSGRFHMDQPTQLRLPGDRPEEGHRGHAGRLLQRGKEDRPQLDDLRNTDHRTLRTVGVELPSRVSKDLPDIPASFARDGEGVYRSESPLEWHLELRRIDSIVAIEAEAEVYNFWCPPEEAYIANGFAVHNCTYSDGTKRSKDVASDHLQTGMHSDMNEADSWSVGKGCEIIDDLAAIGVRAVTFSGGGEPLLHPHILTFLKRLLVRNIDVSVITNGELLSGDRAQLLSHAKWIRVSMDYTTSEQMVASRHVSPKAFARVMTNIASFADRKSGCDLGVNFIVTRYNYLGLVEFSTMLKSLGVQNIRFSPVYVEGFIDYHFPIKPDVDAQLERIQALCDDTFSVNSTYDIASPSKSTVRPFTRCLYAQTVPVIGADLGVYCCHNVAYTKHGLIGSIKDRRFSDLWFSEEAKEMLTKFNPSLVCRHECANHAKVELYNELADSHIDNFV